jgi:hypothetical protein
VDAQDVLTGYRYASANKSGSASTRFTVSKLDEIAAMSLEAIWQQESRYINQMLHRLMGKKRFLLLDGEVIGVAEVTRRQRSHA